MTPRASLSAVLALALLLASAAALDFGPSEEIARERGPDVFNAVHDAMRQWGSSLHHNGMSFFLATVPEGVLFHHGNSREQSPTDPDWLAYEIEHAENFARGGRGPGGPGRPGPPGRGGSDDGDGRLQHVVVDGSRAHGPRPGSTEETRGWLHVYRTTQPLRFLYVDGMSGGKTSMGTLDSQDLLLRGDRSSRAERPGAKRAPGGPMDEQQRAVELCKLCEEWQLQGVVRMEAGFEIIKCNFSDGLRQIQALRRPEEGGGGGGGPQGGGMRSFEFLRGLSERYHDIGSTRTIIDYSSMVSAFFFPVNLTNPDGKRPDLPRLSSASDAELSAIKEYLGDAIAERRDAPLRTIDWQDVTDIVVARYADRIKYMAEMVDSADVMAREVGFLLDVYVDYPGDSTDVDVAGAIKRCTDFYLAAVSPVTDADRLIHAALTAVTSEICSALFRVRQLVDTSEDDGLALAESVKTLQSLMDFLRWSRFKRCPPCAVDEVCVIPMWPMGTVEEYNAPRCSNGSESGEGENYWGGFRGRPGGPRRGGPEPPDL
ncbi:hypothetical protein NKR23_g10470 [Pleurostoma richardsiae]|uniref:Uncharacterized protein n=1 Tax=Pleurostoma richardsiae TaxID=41990 RepID=A0AA38R9Z4_9PEZI|nr:hypothetical protein NKR23_g10470 [Pleurostoma richardsiae]